jgi:hypothetical protein
MFRLRFTSSQLFRHLRLIIFFTLILIATIYFIIITSTLIRTKYRQRFFETSYIDPHKDSSILATNNTERLNAAIIILVRNKELNTILYTLKQFEERWNKKYNYPYVYLNDEPFTSEFIEKTSAITKAKTFHGKICVIA